MRLYSKGDNYTLYAGDMLELLEVIPPCSIDAVITDPPYELNFMGKGWDNSGIAFKAETWRKCFTALKTGGYLLAFGGTRTYHRIACAIEDAGFEVRDCVIWLYGSGFPKSLNIGLAIDKINGVESKVIGHSNNKIHLENLGEAGYKSEWDVKEAQNEWAGWGTALKPAYEPIIIARKPCEGSCVANVLKYGVGGLNIDACRIGEGTGEVKTVQYPDIRGDLDCNCRCVYRETAPVEYTIKDAGRYPSNVILTYDETDEREVCGGMPNTTTGAVNVGNPNSRGLFGAGSSFIPNNSNGGDSGNASRYFYCAKASNRDREDGLTGFDDLIGGGMLGTEKQTLLTGGGNIRNNLRKNIHPTVKPCDLMQYLVRLVTPKGGTILDPFNGSGSTGKAVMYENRDRQAGYKYIGIEITPEYLPIADARIKHAITAPIDNPKPDKPITGQITFDDLLKGGD